MSPYRLPSAASFQISKVVAASARGGAADDPIAPLKLLHALGADQHFVFGHFEVCPFAPKRQGHMQIVCVEQAQNLGDQTLWIRNEEH